MAEFTTPDFLRDYNEESIYARMRATMPEDIDLSEGGHAWNLTRPTALIAAELCEFVLPEVIRLIFAKWAYGEYLDSHAAERNITRRAATAATGWLTVTGEPQTVIPAGTLFSTAAANGEPSIDYATMTDAKITANGTATVAIQCTQTGTVGNTARGTIVLVADRNTGITSVTNENEITGGTEEEDDEALRARIAEYDESRDTSYTGCVADYKRWATSVDGVGEATVVPAQDDTGMVTIILTDANGEPATEHLCEEVYNYIMRTDSPGERLAPVNAYLTVVPPATIAIGIKATVELEENATIQSVREAFRANLAKYLPEALEDEEVKYSRVWAVLSGTEGVNDLANLTLGVKTGDTVAYSTKNIPVTSYQLPSIESQDLILTEGTV